jgi:ATP/maltotriose-dependent transcriptional regulator MalT
MFVYDLCDRLEARLIVASRVRPIWATARRELYGDRLELGSAELALSADESAELLSSATPALRETLLIRARGWPAVIGIASVRNSTRRAPGEAVTTTLFRFFAEELFSTTREEFQDELLSMALLPSLSSELMEAHFGDRATSLLTEAIREGFVTMSDRQHDLHPLIREFLFSKITEQRNVEERVRQAVSVSLDLEEWDNAFVLITRFDRVDLIEAFLTAAFMPLTRVGRVSTLEQVAAWTRPYAKGFSPAVGLIEAELALRDGRFELAQELAVHSAERLQCTHALTPHAHWIAGQAAHLSGNFEIASRHFQRARSTATEESDV